MKLPGRAAATSSDAQSGPAWRKGRVLSAGRLCSTSGLPPLSTTTTGVSAWRQKRWASRWVFGMASG